MDYGKFGAGHDFGASKEKTIKIKERMENTKVSRTLSIKMKYFDWIEKNIAHEPDGSINISNAVNELIQCGIAWKEQIKENNQTRLREFSR